MEKMLIISNEASGPVLLKFLVEPPLGKGMKDSKMFLTKMAARPIYGKNL